MAKFSLSSVFDEFENKNALERGLRGKKILVYGGNRRGKTSQCCKFPKPFLIMTEAGGSAIHVPKTPCNTWATFTEIVNELVKVSSVEGERQIETVIIDTVENLVSLSERAVCSEFGVRDLSEITGRLNGYKIARNNFEMTINKLTSCGYCVDFIAHEETVEKTDIDGSVYNYIQPKGSNNEKSSMRFVRDLCDFIFYVYGGDMDKESGKVIPSNALCVGTKNAFAGSRFTSIRPFITPFTANGVKEAIEEAVTKEAERQGIGTTEEFKVEVAENVTDMIEMIKPYFAKFAQVCPEEVQRIVEAELNGKKITEATEEDFNALQNIYNQLSMKALIMNISV